MKKYLIIIIVIFPTCTELQAQYKESDNILEKLKWDDENLNIMIDMRVDYQTDFDRSGLQDNYFHIQTLKIWLAGEIVKGFRYQFRQSVYKPQDLSRDGYSGIVDLAWLAFDFAKRFTVTVGKQAVQFGTFEYDYNTADLYLYTMCVGDLRSYRTGINLTYKFSGQALSLQAINSAVPQFADSSYANKAIAVNTLWAGKLFDGMLNTRWAYGVFQHEKDDFLSWITLGTQLNIGFFTAEADYYRGTHYIDYDTVTGADDLGWRNVKDQSAALNLKCNLGKWKPSAKAVWNNRFDIQSDADAYRSFGISAVSEYYPFKNKLRDLRFHVMFAYENIHFEGSYAAQNNQYVLTALAGVRWLFKAK